MRGRIESDTGNNRSEGQGQFSVFKKLRSLVSLGLLLGCACAQMYGSVRGES